MYNRNIYVVKVYILLRAGLEGLETRSELGIERSFLSTQENFTYVRTTTDCCPSSKGNSSPERT